MDVKDAGLATDTAEVEAAQQPWPTLGVLMLRDGLVQREELEALLDEQRDERQHRISSWRLGEILVERGRVTEDQVARLVAEQYELPYLELDEDDIDMRVATRLPADLVDRFTALPTEILDDGSALVAVSDPGTVLFSDHLRKALGMPIHIAVASPAALRAAIVAARNHARAETTAPSLAWPSGSPAFDVVRHAEDGPPSTSPPARSVSSFAPPDTGGWPPLGALLVRDGLVSEDELETALAQQRLSTNKRLGEILVERRAVTRADVARIVAEQYELPFLDVAEQELDPEVTSLLPLELATRYAAVPLKRQPDGSVLVAVADPMTILDPSELSSTLDAKLSFAVADPDVIESALDKRRLQPLPETPVDREPAVPEKDAPAEMEAAAETMGSEDEEDEEPPALSIVPVLDETKESAPEDDVEMELDEETDVGDDEAPDAVVPLSVADLPAEAPEPPHVLQPETRPAFDELLERARDLGATGLRFSPSPDGVVVHVTVEDGLRELDAMPDADPATIARALRTDEGFDVVVLPTRRGEVVHVRLASDPVPPRELSELGLEADAEDILRSALVERSGLVLLSGPARSGPAATAYALLDVLTSAERNVVTIEDPIERTLDGIDQIEAGHESGLTVAQGLGRIVRMEPDTVFVSETADERTADLVVRGAERALILTTVRAHTAPDAVRLLVALGADPSALAATLRAVVAQCAVRRICLECREGYFASRDEVVALGLPEEEAGRRLLGRGRGCEHCGSTGFEGRVEVFEVVPSSAELRKWVASGVPAEGEPAPVGGSARDEVVRLCLDGLTTVSETRRVLGLP